MIRRPLSPPVEKVAGFISGSRARGFSWARVELDRPRLPAAEHGEVKVDPL
jgi:hypothetical protein